MTSLHQQRQVSRTPFSSAGWTEQMFSRAAGAPISTGNSVHILKDAVENYPAWLRSIQEAEKWIHFESYIMHEDETGQEFGELLARKAQEGLKVRVTYDWLGGFRKTSRYFWQKLRDAGVEVRCFNPPRPDSPLGWITRDHRKMIGIDGNVAFVTGLCVGRMWTGDSGKSIDPWRDTGISVTGPAVTDIEAAFAQIWAATGEALPADEIPGRDSIVPTGNVSLRVVATTPNTGGVYRLDQQIAALARKSLWLTDAYYLGTASYIQALRAAAMDGVDVRLLVPGATDIPIVRTLSRAGYKPLLEAGIRLFEWNGSMIHAKTAVTDGFWSRVGSTNLNLASWIGNYELDVVVEDKDFAQKMEEMYLSDIENATEIVLSTGHRRRSPDRRSLKRSYQSARTRGSVGRVGAGAIRIGNMVGAAIANRRVLGPAEARIPLIGGVALLIFAALFLLFPRLAIIPIATVCAWFGFALVIKAWRLHRIRFATHGNDEEDKKKEGFS